MPGASTSRFNSRVPHSRRTAPRHRGVVPMLLTQRAGQHAALARKINVT
ncbi:hypothetical protein [Lysobacter gummosus]